jgi:hypothetical protein
MWIVWAGTLWTSVGPEGFIKCATGASTKRLASERLQITLDALFGCKYVKRDG